MVTCATRPAALKLLSFTLLAAATAIGCETPAASSGSNPATGSNTAAATSATAAGTTSGAAAATTATSSAEPGSPHAGGWKAECDAVRGGVKVPDGIPYTAWKGDDGGAHSGPSSVALTVDRHGEVKGTASGALGDLQIRGEIHDGELRAGLTPRGAEGMSGILVGKVSSGNIVAQLRVADASGGVVRTCRVTFKHQP